MPTPPFGPVLEANLKHDLQGGKLNLALGITVDPQFHCCISGTPVMALKDPVAKLKVSPSSACTGMPVTANYAGSMSPTSTLVTWSIDWGDGNSSNGAWLGPGSANHPLGGYAVPAHYQITLTVTDQLGAVGTESVTHVALDCTSGIPVEVLGGCGASGPFHSANGGFTWESIGGGVLDGATIFDMKATWFSFGLTIQEVWAATSLGLYKGEVNIATRAATWERISLGTGIVARAIGHSKYAAAEVYILAESGGGTPYLYRTTDGGETWASVQLGALQWQAVGVLGGGIFGTSLAWNSVREEMYVGCTGFDAGTCPGYPWPPFITTTLRWNGAVWDTMLEGIGEDGTEDLVMDNITGTLYMAGGFDFQCLTACSDFAAWDSVNNEYRLYPPLDYATSFTNVVEIHRGLVWWWAAGVPWEDYDVVCRRGHSWVGVGRVQGTVSAMASNIHHLYIGGNFSQGLLENPNAARLARITDPEGTWDAVGGSVQNGTVYAISFDAAGHLLIGGSFTTVAGQSTSYMARWLGGYEWQQMGTGDEKLNGAVYCIKVLDNGTIYVGGAFTATVGGTILNRVARWDELNEAWRPVGVSGFNSGVWDLEFDDVNNQLWATGTFTTADGNAVEGVVRLEAGTATIPTVGRTHLIDMDASGGYVYVALLGSGGTPLVFRVAYDLSVLEEAYSTGAGTWGGVACDPYNPARVWVFGNFGAAAKVLYTDDWGVTFTNVTDGSWGATELVRPLLLSEWSSQDAVAVLNVALQAWQTKNDGADWANNGTIDFAAQCGVRDPLEPLNVWIGRAAAGANHIQYSPNVGDDWLEWSTGFTPNAPVTSLQVIG